MTDCINYLISYQPATGFQPNVTPRGRYSCLNDDHVRSDVSIIVHKMPFVETFFWTRVSSALENNEKSQQFLNQFS